MKLLRYLIFLLPGLAAASPFVISDPTAQNVTHCGIVLDSAPKYDVPVVTDATGKYCKVDMTAVATGAHTISASFVLIDPMWGRLESPQSAPFSFVRPANPGAPVNIQLVK